MLPMRRWKQLLQPARELLSSLLSPTIPRFIQQFKRSSWHIWIAHQRYFESSLTTHIIMPQKMSEALASRFPNMHKPNILPSSSPSPHLPPPLLSSSILALIRIYVQPSLGGALVDLVRMDGRSESREATGKEDAEAAC